MFIFSEGYEMQDNDRTIFSYLNPKNNDMLSKLNKKDLYEILLCLDKYYLEYRDLLGINSDITFGIEIELEHFKCTLEEFYNFQLLINEVVGNENWNTKNDVSLYNYNEVNGKIDFGREIASGVLMDKGKSWTEIKKVCDVVSSYGTIGDKCGAHIHVGAHILGDNTLYWYRFLKLCTVYENVIFRFLYGEYLTHRSMMMEKTKPGALFYDSKLAMIFQNLDSGLFNMLKILNCGDDFFSKELKYYGISFWHMLCDDNYLLYDDYNIYNKHCTVECRAANGTTDPIIWQNNINFFIKLLLYCKSDNFNDDILDRRKIESEGIFGDLWAYSKIYLEQSILLCDMIFDNNLDKLYFLRQYIKSFEVSDKVFAKARKITDTRR